MSEQSKKLNIDLGFLDKKKPTTVAQRKEIEIIPKDKHKIIKNNSVRPWIRYWARYIDIFVFSLAFGIFLEIFIPSALELSEIFLTVLILFVWVFAESALLSSWGTTPGKWLLKINIKGQNEKIDFSSALNRSFAVWLKGLGLGIPIISIFTLISSYNHLAKEGVTIWDKDGHFTVTHKKIGAIRIIVAIVVSILFFLLIFSE
jgi:uncharacterized RDD family membrane protein YckC